jgi:hypothetical protein
MLRMSSVAAAAIAFATAGSALFGGVALADEFTNTGGAGGAGGQSQAQCAIPIGVSLGLVGAGGPVAQCNSTGGAGGVGGAGAVLGD